MFGTIEAIVPVTAPFQPTPNPFAIGDDIAVLGAWSGDNLPVAFSNDDGSFTVTNHLAGPFAGWARQPNVQRVSDKFNGDPYTDFALIGGPGWQSIPLALSDSTGRFTIKNELAGDFGNLFGSSTAKALTGDFNHDGYTDIALTGGQNWASIPVAFSIGFGNFDDTNTAVNRFGVWASDTTASALVGQVNWN